MMLGSVPHRRWSPAILALVAILGLLVVAGCGGSDQPAAQSVLPTPESTPVAAGQAPGDASPLPTPAELPPDLRGTDLGDGWVQYEPAGAGFSIALPLEWSSYPLADKEIYLSPAGIDQLVDLDGVRFYALDLSSMYTSQRDPAGVVVLRYDLGQEVSLEAQTALELKAIDAYIGAEEAIVEEYPTTLSGVEAWQIVLHKERVGTLEQPMTFILYLVPDGQRLYKIVFQIPSDIISTHLDLARAIAGRFRLTGP